MTIAPLAPHSNGAANGGNLIETYAAKVDMSGKALFETMVATIFPTGRNVPPATREHVQALLMVAEAYDLNPMTKELYAFPQKGGSGIVPIVSVDGWYKLISRHPQSNGYTATVAFAEDGTTPVSATCVMHRKDWDHPVVVTEYVSECKRDTIPWNTQPARMIRHRAIIQAARSTFGFGGIYEADEGARMASHVPKELEVPREVEIEQSVADEMNAEIEARKAKSAMKEAVHKDAQTAGAEPNEHADPAPTVDAEKAAAKRRQVVAQMLEQFATRDIGRAVLQAEFGDLEKFSMADAQRAADIWMRLEDGTEPQDAFGAKAAEVYLGGTEPGQGESEPDLGPDSDEPSGHGALFTSDREPAVYGEDT
ncbi:RecT family protein [Planctomycetes bacterium Poly30]|uniref:RecT family protein n=1 Tax=Saltatorellus ferox TaxID=2528018 RepID=A0A518EZ01_9BACT|nr:RecT family protein [Planctomycetes bacterium Poly30]